MLSTGKFKDSMKRLSDIEAELQAYLAAGVDTHGESAVESIALLHQAGQALHEANELLGLAEQRETELDRMLIRQNRKASMGEMIGNIAHQWRQPLHALSLIAETLRDHESDERNTEFINGSVDQIMNLVLYMSRTIDDFSDFFQPDREMKPFDLEDAVKKTLILVRDSFKATNIIVDIESHDHLIVTGYPNEYSQALLNILNNARDALLERKVTLPRVTIRLFREGKKAVAVISDNAGGISEKIISRIFEPYLTTKETTNGSGLGLYITRTIIERRMHGSISVRNTDEGAEFRIEL